MSSPAPPPYIDQIRTQRDVGSKLDDFDDKDFERLRASYKRLKAASKTNKVKDEEIARLKAQLSLLRWKLAYDGDLKAQLDELRASYTLQRNAHSADEVKNLKAEIEALRLEKTDRTLGIEDCMRQLGALKAENETLKEGNTALQGEVEHFRTELRAEREQKEALEAQNKVILGDFNDYKKRLRRMGNE